MWRLRSRGAWISLVVALSGCPGAEPSAGSEEVSAGVSRLTPEQVRNSLEESLGQNYGFDMGNGELHSYITSDLAIPLGGNDFSYYVRKRDPSTKVQTLLVARTVAWPIAVHLVEEELQQPPPTDTLFTKCSPTEDFPGNGEESRARWEAQVQDFYLRLFSREATSEEIALIETTFETVRVRDGRVASAGMVTLYALTASMETWNTWR